MWIFVMFDLPVGPKQRMREAAKFREFLLDEGFESHFRRIEMNLPQKGDIHVLTFTDRQYENIVRLRPRKSPDQLVMF